MRTLRHLGFLLCLAFAFAIGQQGAVLHALGHATEQVQNKGDPKPWKTPCEQCALAAQPAGMPVAGMPPVPVVTGTADAAPWRVSFAPARPFIVFLSRAPPVLL
jgi:hypothetical protein